MTSSSSSSSPSSSQSQSPSPPSSSLDREVQERIDELSESELRLVLKCLVLLHSEAVQNAIHYVQMGQSSMHSRSHSHSHAHSRRSLGTPVAATKRQNPTSPTVSVASAGTAGAAPSPRQNQTLEHNGMSTRMMMMPSETDHDEHDTTGQDDKDHKDHSSQQIPTVSASNASDSTNNTPFQSSPSATLESQRKSNKISNGDKGEQSSTHVASNDIDERRSTPTTTSTQTTPSTATSTTMHVPTTPSTTPTTTASRTPTLLVLCTGKPTSRKQAEDQDKAMTICKQAGIIPNIILKESQPQLPQVQRLHQVAASATAATATAASPSIDGMLQYPQFFVQQGYGGAEDGSELNVPSIYYLGSFETIQELHTQGRFHMSLLVAVISQETLQPMDSSTVTHQHERRQLPGDAISSNSLQQQKEKESVRFDPSSENVSTKEQQQHHQLQQQQQQQQSSTHILRQDDTKRDLKESSSNVPLANHCSSSDSAHSNNNNTFHSGTLTSPMLSASQLSEGSQEAHEDASGNTMAILQEGEGEQWIKQQDPQQREQEASLGLNSENISHEKLDSRDFHKMDLDKSSGEPERGVEPKKSHESKLPSIGFGACYLVYDAVAAELNIYYSEVPIIGAVGVWTSPDIVAFKEAQGLGRSELIGNCARGCVQDRQQYYQGWCQFVKAAKSMDATVTILDVGVPVDFYLYSNGTTIKATSGEFETTPVDAVACVPRNVDFPGMNLKGKKWSKAAKRLGAVAVFRSISNRDGGEAWSYMHPNDHDHNHPPNDQAMMNTSLARSFPPGSAPPTIPEDQALSESATTPTTPPREMTTTKLDEMYEAVAHSNHSLPEHAIQDTANTPIASSVPHAAKAGPNENTATQEDLGVSQAPPPPDILSPTPPPSQPATISTTSTEGFSSPSEAPNPEGGACYLIYEPDSSGRLVERYSKTPIVDAIGRWAPSATSKKKIAGFKFKQNLGKNILIGSCSAGQQGRRNYCSGWCQFVRSARVMEADVMLWDPVGKGMMVDVYLYQNDNRPTHQTLKLQPGVATNVDTILAVCCIPKSTPFYEGMAVDILKWLADGSTYGASSRF